MAVAPRLYGGLLFGFRIADPARAFVRAGYSWFDFHDVDAFALDLRMGGFQASLGVEVRR